LIAITRTQPRHPSLLVFDDPLQRFDGVLLFPDLLLKMIEMFQDQSHVDAHLVDILTMTVYPTRNMVNLLLVILEGVLLGNDVGSELSLQSIALSG